MSDFMKEFSQIKYKDLDISFLEEKGFIGYAFHYMGNNYANKVAIKTRKRKELAEAIATLFINAISSYEELCKK